MLVGTYQRTAEADDLVIEISNSRLERVNKFKYLGVLLDNTLSWKHQSCISAAIAADWIILHWYVCGTDGLSVGRSVYGHVITEIFSDG